MSDLESLLKEKDYLQELIQNNKNIEIIPLNINSQPQKADKSATLFDFIKMVDKIVSLTMKDVLFIPEEGKIIHLDAMKKIDKTIITYSVKSREPHKEIKPRLRQNIKTKDNNDGEDRDAQVWGQKFKCTVQFNIFASVYKDAEEVMEKFEELITSYTGYFKKNGVSEVYLLKHFTDDVYEQLRETLSVRNLHYYVEIEKLTVIFKEKIKEIEILAQKEGGK